MKHLTLAKRLAATCALCLGLGLWTAPSQAQVALSWKDNSANETNFVVERATASGGPWSAIASLGSNVKTYTDTTATTGGMTYYYRVKATTSAWTSRYTNVASKAIASVPVGTGTGLKGQYYNGQSFNTLILTRTDPQVNFTWSGSPATSVTADNFSVRWTGQVQAQEAGTYTFQTTTDDGVKLYLNGATTPQINKWITQTATAYTTTITLTAGQKIAFKMEFLEVSGGASAKLEWKRPGQTSFALVPKSQLYPAP